MTTTVTETQIVTEKDISVTTTLKKPTPILGHYNEDANIIEIGVDEVGRGPLFGRVYAAAVILPKHKHKHDCEDDNETENHSFDHRLMKDSKKFTSAKKLKEAHDHIVAHCVDYSVCYESETTIDEINILQATQKAMHKCIDDLISRNSLNAESTLLLIDGNYFRPHTLWDKESQSFTCFSHECVKGGDALYSSIAAASILAKVRRDAYINDMCDQHPELDDRYSLRSNKGYGAKKHRDGIQEHGISPWHRKSFGICKEFSDVV